LSSLFALRPRGIGKKPNDGGVASLTGEGAVGAARLVAFDSVSDGTVKANKYRPFSASNPAQHVGDS
jgi:hypothetical protein